MMNQLHGYEKIRMIRENEKNDAQLKFQEATAEFEKHASHLYDLLKKKEKIEESYKQSLSDKSQIETIKSYHQYLDFLMPAIVNVQKKVDAARKYMDQVQEYVTEHYIEVKKIEKIIDKKEQQYRQLEDKKNLMLMDEISIRKYIEK
ncbi:flagellar export protein FliJ [Gracilibacillus lacisalsi]|uniref:flagellar export protein FliJ n=1 Tax=Gracilibacillus lacisalsi TaxID=393087 RepID=UPI0003755C52|nr:flagellar export protein FliJ [Gracilibacillus lacisalsi]